MLPARYGKNEPQDRLPAPAGGSYNLRGAGLRPHLGEIGGANRLRQQKREQHARQIYLRHREPSLGHGLQPSYSACMPPADSCRAAPAIA